MSNNIASGDSLALESVPGWSNAHVQSMKNAWITTAEQVVALAAVPGGIGSLAAQLGTDKQETQRLVANARMALSPETRRQMETEVDRSQYGLGAILPSSNGES